MMQDNTHRWIVLLGGSSGIGLATARLFASKKFNLLIVHRDRRERKEELSDINDQLTTQGNKVIWLNADASLPNTIQLALDEIAQADSKAQVTCLLHSIARGNVKPLVNAEKVLSRQDFHVTADNMAFNLIDWTSEIHGRSLFEKHASIVALTSEGSSRAIANYAAVGVAKAALEAVCRSIAKEYAPFHIRCNVIQSGICITPSFSMIPGHEELKATAEKRNPSGRLTLPEDVANAIYLLSTPEARWITGTIIPVDGGESIS